MKTEKQKKKETWKGALLMVGIIYGTGLATGWLAKSNLQFSLNLGWGGQEWAKVELAEHGYTSRDVAQKNALMAMIPPPPPPPPPLPWK